MLLRRRRLLLLICLHLWTMKILKVWLKWTPRDGCLHPPTLSTTCQVVSARPHTHPPRVMRNPMRKNYVKFGSSKVKLHLCHLCFTRAYPRHYFRRIRVVASYSATPGWVDAVAGRRVLVTRPACPARPSAAASCLRTRDGQIRTSPHKTCPLLSPLSSACPTDPYDRGVSCIYRRQAADTRFEVAVE